LSEASSEGQPVEAASFGLEPVGAVDDVHPVRELPVDESAHDFSSFSPEPLGASVDEAAPAVLPPLPVEPVAHEPVAHEPVAHEPVAHEPMADAPIAREPFAPEPLLPESPAPEPIAYEPLAYEPIAPNALEPIAPEPIADEPIALPPVSAAPVSPELISPEPVSPEPVLAEFAAFEPVSPPVELAEPWLAAPELPPAPVSEPATAVVVHPPVSAAELPPLPDAAAKGPFWKKELSFSRKPKEPKAPKAAKVPKSERAPKEQGASVPFWKKQVSLGRKPKLPAEIAAADVPTVALPAAPKLPFWKKLSFSMPSLSLPKRSSGGGKSGGHAVKKLVGLKIGSSQLAAARVSNNGVAEVQQLAREALAPGIVVGGELRDPEALGVALKGFFARNKLPRKGVRLGIASNRIGVRIFDIVGVTEDKQLANAIHFRAQEALPIPLDEAVLDFRVLDESVDAEGQSVKRVLLVVVYRELVERYVNACKKAGITLAGIDLEAFALLRSLAPPIDRGSSALVGVAIGYDRSTFAVSDGRVCEFTRVLEWGGSSLNVALARTFDSTPSEVEAIKRSLSLDESTVPPGLTPEQAAQAIDVVRRQVQSFARELVSSLQFYQNQPGSLGIGEIVLTGGTTHLPGLAAELERLIGVHVRVGDPFARVKVSKKLADTEQSGSLAVAIGLGIED
jgi:type IV pilus assembly protein PilM